MQDYGDANFQQAIEEALRRIREILDATKAPCVASDVHHVYDDKFLLAEFLTSTALAAQLNALEALGLNADQLGAIRAWADTRAVVLRFKAEETCEYDRTETHNVESGTTRKEIETKGVFGTSKRTVDHKVITKIEKYYWKFSVRYQVEIVSVTAASSRVVVLSGKGDHEIVTTTDKPPRPKVSLKPDIDINLEVLLDSLTAELKCGFVIDRNSEECHTPRRNDEVEGSLRYFAEFGRWCTSIHRYFVDAVFPVVTEQDRDLSMIACGAVFVPVIPVFQEVGDDGGEVTLSSGDIQLLLRHQKRTLHQTFEALSQGFSDDATLASLPTARLLVTVLHGAQIASHYRSSIEFIEAMLAKQLVAAIGKVVTPDDFTEYMRFHNRRLFASTYAPVPFHHAIRRPEHYPEGVISIEQSVGKQREPINTHVRIGVAATPMHFLINAATKVTFLGDRYLHGWVSHQFAADHASALVLAARAREFSGFVLMVGRIASAELFEPKAAMIVQNRDELRIPLMLEQIPTPKEFKDAIESLSPEQQRFAKAYRGMQLESTLFGLCIVQIKPQLERLLKLPDDSLTKEIKLTQQLLELFVTYQIPSDLISYAGDADASVDDKTAAVAGHVANMYAMIQDQKDAQLADKRQEQGYGFAALPPSLAVQVSHVGAPPPPGGPPPAPKGAPQAFGPPPGPGAPPPAPAGGAAPPPPAARSAAPRAPTVPSAASASAPVADVPSPSVSMSSPSMSTTKPSGVAGGSAASSSEGGVDYTQIPLELDRRFEELDEDNALRPTIIKPGRTWTLRRRESLLSEPEVSTLGEAEQRSERDRAFDLLDALSRSGSLPIAEASLHVVVAATHAFDKTLTQTVIQRSVNPIERIERSSLIVAATIHQTSPAKLTRPEHLERVQTFAPALFAGEGAPPEA